MRIATGCVCGRHFMEEANEGTCLMCGHGDAVPTLGRNRPCRLQRLPRDLGSIARSGRRLPRGRFQNVIA